MSNSGNNRIHKFTNDGVFITAWGSPGSGNGQFGYPCGMAVDASGNVFVSDNGNERIQKFTNDGAYIATWGSYGTADGQFINPDNLGVDAAGNVYVADRLNSRIQKFINSGAFIRTLDRRGAAPWPVFLSPGRSSGLERERLCGGPMEPSNSEVQ